MPVPVPVAARRRVLPPLPLEEDEAGRRGVDPLLFHAVNLVAHAGVSALVLRWVLGGCGWPGLGIGTGGPVEAECQGLVDRGWVADAQPAAERVGWSTLVMVAQSHIGRWHG